MNGDREGGVSIIDLHPTVVDAGNVLVQQTQPIRPFMYYRELETELAELGGKLASEVLDDFEAFWNEKRAQDELQVSQTRKIVDSMGEISFLSMSAEQISRTVRALGHQIPIKAKLKADNRWIFMEEPVLGEDALKGLQPGALVYKRHRQKATLFIGAADGNSIGFSAFKVTGKSSIFSAGDFYANFARKSGSFA
jgi:methionyl-tRNA formyltransferase